MLCHFELKYRDKTCEDGCHGRGRKHGYENCQTTIIALHRLDGDTKLSSGIGKKVRQCGKGVRFES